MAGEELTPTVAAHPATPPPPPTAKEHKFDTHRTTAKTDKRVSLYQFLYYIHTSEEDLWIETSCNPLKLMLCSKLTYLPLFILTTQQRTSTITLQCLHVMYVNMRSTYVRTHVIADSTLSKTEESL